MSSESASSPDIQLENKPKEVSAISESKGSGEEGEGYCNIFFKLGLAEVTTVNFVSVLFTIVLFSTAAYQAADSKSKYDSAVTAFQTQLVNIQSDLIATNSLIGNTNNRITNITSLLSNSSSFQQALVSNHLLLFIQGTYTVLKHDYFLGLNKSFVASNITNSCFGSDNTTHVTQLQCLVVGGTVCVGNTTSTYICCKNNLITLCNEQYGYSLKTFLFL